VDNLDPSRLRAALHHPVLEVTRARQGEIDQLLAAHGGARIAAVVPVLRFDVGVIHTRDLGPVGSQERQQLIAEITVRHDHHVDPARVDQV
jgi:hypothetical protein